MSKIKERASKIKNANGNDKITQKDLLFYIIGRLDDIENELSESKSDVAKLKTQVKVFWILLPIAISLTVMMVSSL